MRWANSMVDHPVGLMAEERARMVHDPDLEDSMGAF